MLIRGAVSARVEIVEGAPSGGSQGKVLVAIDVLRAFTTASWALERGVAALVLAASAAEALDCAREIPGSLVLGEVGGLPVPGCDLGNSPLELDRYGALGGKTVVFFSSHGVPTLLACRGGERVLAAGYVNSYATATAIRSYLSAAGSRPVEIVVPEFDGDEDLACAEHIADLVAGRPSDTAAVESRIWRSAAAKFLDPGQSRFDPLDLEAATSLAGPAAVAALGEHRGRTALVPLDALGDTR